jgi:hypothetical protein
MSIFSTIAKAMQSVFNEEANEIAKETGFIKRQRKVTGSNFIKTFLFGWMQTVNPSVEGLARAGIDHELEISAQGLDQRFTKEACDFVKSVLERALSKVIKAENTVDIEILNRFTAIYVNDSTIIMLPDELKDTWKGTGGSHGSSESALKVDTSIELKSGQLQFSLLQGKDSDSKSPIAECVYEKDVLRLQDLGYFKLNRMARQAERGEYWISRLQPGTKVFEDGNDNQLLDLPRYLADKKENTQIELNVIVGSKAHLKSRLLLWKLPQEPAGRRRAKLKENAKKHGRIPTADNLTLCDWSPYITNVEKEKLSLEECYLLYSVRWQIELLFKLWKSHSQLGHSRSKNPHRILCEVYLKLIVVVVQHWLILTGLWDIPQRSLVKGVQLIQEQSAVLAKCMTDFNKLVDFLKQLAKRFEIGCSLNKRSKKPNTVDQLINKKYQYSLS